VLKSFSVRSTMDWTFHQQRWSESIWVLTLNAGVLYGTARNGGGSGYGTVFKLDLGGASPTSLSFQKTGNQLVLNWTNSAFNLQCSTNVAVPTPTFQADESVHQYHHGPHNFSDYR